MEKYKTITSFTELDGFMALIAAVVTAIPNFFSIFLIIFCFMTAAGAYFIIVKTTGKKRFWHALTATSFVSFLLALTIAGMNSATIEYINGYWIGFYILMTLGSWYMLTTYK